MKILCTSPKLIAGILGIQPIFSDHPTDKRCFASFLSDDRNLLENARIYEAPNDAMGGFELTILEDHASSSQLVRLREWSGASVVTIALKGDGFIGQGAHTWCALDGNLHWCAAIPVQIPIERAQVLQRIPAVILWKILYEELQQDINCHIKPPNDIVIFLPKPHKIAGCLTELAANSHAITMVRFGIGLNTLDAPDNAQLDHLPAACCVPYLRNAIGQWKRPFLDELCTNSIAALYYRRIVYQLSKGIITHIRAFEANPYDETINELYDARCCPILIENKH